MPVTLQILLICVALIGLLVLGFFLARWLKTRYDTSRDASAEPAGMSLQQMEKLHERGLISDEEFQRMRRVALGLDAGREKPSTPDGPDGIMSRCVDVRNQSGSTDHKDKGT